MLAESWIAQPTATQHGERVVLTLLMAAGVTVHHGLSGITCNRGGLVGGIAHARRGEFGEKDVDHGP